MKILIAADIFPPQPGGPATYSVTIANELTKAGDDVKVVSLNPDSDLKSVICKIFAVKNKNKFFKYLEYFFLLLKHSKDVDVIYAMGPVNAGLPSLVTAKIRRKRMATKVVGDYAWEQGVQRFGVKDTIDEFQKKKNYRLKVRFLKWVQSYVTKNSTNVIVPSVYLKGIVMNWGLVGHCVQVIYNSSSFKEFCKMEKPSEERWIVSAGRLVPWKGMDVLIDVMPDIIKKHPDIKLKIFGSGPEMDKLKAKVAEMKLQNIVELPGSIDRKDLICNLSLAELFVLNSGYEGLSHLILEAMHVGVIVLASDSGGNSELVIPGKNGDLFPLNDREAIKEKINKLLDSNYLEWDQEERNRFFEQFSLENMIKNTREALQNICKR
jgi:glycosyltransferase involved in cell wall biosynthesis